MECGRCAAPLEKPGDYCLVCRTGNADGVVVECARDRATLSILDEKAVVGETTITTTPETGEAEPVELRNFAGRIVDEVRRKRPEAVYLSGDRDVIGAVRADLHQPCYRVAGEDPVEAALATRGERDLEVVEGPPAAKIGGRHTTLIGGRVGRRAVEVVAGHPHVKKVVPGPIDAGGNGSRSGVRAKVTRADDNGNVRMLLRGGSSVQENRIVTTAMNRDLGERIRDDLDGRLRDADLR